MSIVALLAVCVAAGLAGLSAAVLPPRPNPEECISLDVDFVLFPEEARLERQLEPKVQAATDFKLEYFDDYKIVTTYNDGELVETYVLVQCGRPAPPDDDIPKNAKIFEIPLYRLAVQDTTVNEFLTVLGVEDRVVFAAQSSIDACFQKLVDDCERSFGGFEVTEEEAEVVDSVWTFAAEADQPKYIQFAATKDPGLERRAEWIKFVAAFFNKEAEAQQAFKLMRSRLSDLEELAAASNAGSKPLVAWVVFEEKGAQYTKCGGTADFVLFSSAAYKANLATASGAVIVDPAYVNSLKLSKGEFSVVSDDEVCIQAGSDAYFEVLKNVNVLVDEDFYGVDLPDYDTVAGIYGFPDAPEPLPFVENKKVFTTDGEIRPAGDNGLPGLNWFEDAIWKVDAVLQDMILAVSPEVLEAKSKQRFLRNVSTGSKHIIITKSACPALSCKEAPSPICPVASRDDVALPADFCIADSDKPKKPSKATAANAAEATNSTPSVEKKSQASSGDDSAKSSTADSEADSEAMQETEASSADDSAESIEAENEDDSEATQDTEASSTDDSAENTEADNEADSVAVRRSFVVFIVLVATAAWM